MRGLQNVNCGVLGHVDSGKTALCRSLHEIASTASMDKHPQSRERGITIDLGFSSFMLASTGTGVRTQITLVDCPGHASLLKTVLAGAQIIDMCVLVLDARKGFQAQTVECVVIAEIVTTRLIVAVNKIDLIDVSERASYITKMESGIRKAMGNTVFGPGLPIVFVSATETLGLGVLTDTMSRLLDDPPRRDSTGCFNFAFDHCFSLKGQGTVFTGTILSGEVRKGQKVALNGNEAGEVRSIQMFRCPVTSASQGDRVGLGVPGISANGRERGELCDPNATFETGNIVLSVIQRVKQFKGMLDNSKLHITTGHTQCMASPIFLRLGDKVTYESLKSGGSDDRSHRGCLGSGYLAKQLDIQWESVYRYLQETAEINLLDDFDEVHPDEPILCLLLLDRRIKFRYQSLFVASRLDLNDDHKGCRIAFFGRVVHVNLKHFQAKVIKEKVKIGRVERIIDATSCLVSGLMRKGGDISRVSGLRVINPRIRSTGVIESSFGKSGLVKVLFESGIDCDSLGDSISLKTKHEAISKLVESHVE